jgi:hypothetical protein
MSLKIDKIPIAVFAYNRPDLLDLLLLSLKEDCVELLYVFSDGSKSIEHDEKVREVREIINNIDWCEIHIVEHSENLGLGKSIKYGVSLVLSKHNSIIVFEDDLICVKGTYNYLSSALNHYENHDNVMSVTGWTHPKITPSALKDMPYFDGKAECWSWGTWARAWEGMDQSTLQIYNQCVMNGIDFEKYGTDMPKMALEAKQKNLWAVGWWYHHLLKGGLCLRPPYSLIETTGWDGRGTTITPEMKEWANPPLKKCPPIPELYPEPVENNSCPELWRTAIDDKVTKLYSQPILNNDLSKLGEGIWILNDLLTKTESNFLVLKSKRNQFDKARNGEKYGRYNQETYIDDQEILNLLRERLEQKLSDSPIGFFSLENTTHILEFYRYFQGDSISQHQDAPVPISKSTQTTHTIVIYLNDNFKGGETYFNDQDIKAKVDIGSAILFDQFLNHQGNVVLEGEKYILRFGISIKKSKLND